MIKFEFNGIKIKAAVEVEQHDFQDAFGRTRSRFDRSITVEAGFWNFRIMENLSEFAFIKSTLQYFMQGYWKRASKAGGKIDLSKTLHHHHIHAGKQSLWFVARQKDGKHYLQICLKEEGATVNEVYLDGQEVIMLDIAIGKAINLLSPSIKSSELCY